jgi:hypothetical protein
MERGEVTDPQASDTDSHQIESIEYFEQRMQEMVDGMINTLDKAMETTCQE